MPNDWAPWLAYGDMLRTAGDARGDLIRCEHRLDTAVLSAAEATALGAKADTLADDWWSDFKYQVTDMDREWLNGYIALAMRLRQEVPLEPGSGLAQAFQRPWAHLLAPLEVAPLEDPELITSGLSASLMKHRADLAEALTTFTVSAYDGVPLPDDSSRTLSQASAADDYEDCDRSTDHLGRWQDLPDSQLLSNQWALPHLDAQGFAYYLPALITFHLRHMDTPHPKDIWLSWSFECGLAPDGRHLLRYRRGKFKRLDKAQRIALWCFRAVMGYWNEIEDWENPFATEFDPNSL